MLASTGATCQHLTPDGTTGSNRQNKGEEMIHRLTMRLPDDVLEGLERYRRQLRELTGLDPSLPAAALALLRSGLASAGCLELEQ